MKCILWLRCTHRETCASNAIILVLRDVHQLGSFDKMAHGLTERIVIVANEARIILRAPRIPLD